MQEASGDNLIGSSTQKVCHRLLKKVWIFMHILNTHRSVHSVPFKEIPFSWHQLNDGDSIP